MSLIVALTIARFPDHALQRFERCGLAILLQPAQQGVGHGRDIRCIHLTTFVLDDGGGSFELLLNRRVINVLTNKIGQVFGGIRE